MKKDLFPFSRVLRLILVAVLGLVCATAYGDNAAGKKDEPSRPRSVFEDNPNTGKDPFFPKSTRRRQEIVRAVATNAPPTLPSAELALKGISGSKSQPLALINTTTVGLGEKAEVKCGQQAIMLRCLEIRDRSVLIEIVATGELRELRLREGI